MAITANFTATTSREGYIPFTVTFQDQTTGGTPTVRRWNYGDGTLSLNETSPTHTYTEEGIYNVSLYVKDALSNESTEIKQQFIIANGVYPLSEGIIVQSQTPGKFWKFYIDQDLHILFQYNNRLYKTINPAAVLDKWMLVEFHPGDNFIYLGTGETERQIIPSKLVDLGSSPTITEDRLFITPNSSFQIDELKIWKREVDLRPYYRSLKYKAFLLDQ